MKRLNILKMLSKRLGTIFALSPILGIYMVGIPVLSLSQILLIVLSVICLVKSRRKLHIFFPYFILYALLISLMRFPEAWVITEHSIHDILSLLLFFFILFSTISYADYCTFKTTIIKLGLVSLVFFIVQYILSLINIKISGILPFLPLSNETPTSEFIAIQLSRDRLSGLFQEPAHYSEFMVIALIFMLFSNNRDYRSIIFAILISLSIYLTGSATGLAMVGVVWLYWLFIYKITDSNNKLFYMLFWLGFVLLVSYFAIQNDSVMNLVGRFGEISGESSGEHGRSSYIRVVRGYIPFLESKLGYKLFGNGLGNLLGYINSNPHSKYLLLTDFNPNWINGFQYLLFTTGIIGTLLYGIQVFKFYITTSIIGKILIICMLLMFLSSDSFFSVGLILYIVIMERSANKKVKSRDI